MSRQRVEFINLSQADSDGLTAAARLAAYHHGQGSKVLIVAQDQAEAEKMDERLWTYEQNSFVPHAVAGGADQDQEPVLISVDPVNRNGAGVQILLHPPEGALGQGFKLIILMIPREDGPELKTCRALYAKLRDAGDAEVAHITSLP
jgi:DNA polymerase-3 subunit chi